MVIRRLCGRLIVVSICALLTGSHSKLPYTRNEEFVLPGFGKLVLSKRQAREGRNPQTGETIKIAAKTTLKFRLSKAMKDTAAPAKKK